MNIKHHSLALWGLRLRLDPDYPKITRFAATHITDTVFEYRSYPLLALWGLLLAMGLPPAVLWLLVALWAVQSFHRARLYASPLLWWEQAWKESPNKTRCRIRYAEQLMEEINRRYLEGESWEDLQGLVDSARRLQDELCTPQ